MKTSVIILIVLISIYLIYLAISYYLLKPLAYKKASNQIGGKFEISSDPLIWILSSRILNYSIKVKGEVRNKGGDGYIIVKATAIQEGQEWDRTQKIYLTAYESAPFEFIFDEVKLLKDDPTYKVKAYAMGSVIE